jgi:hypothetical protein
VRRIARAISRCPCGDRNRASSAKPRNPANEMRFPVSREDGGNASALSPVRGGRSRLSLARKRGAQGQRARPVISAAAMPCSPQIE